MMRLRFSTPASITIVEQSDYYREQQGPALEDRWIKAVDAATRSLLVLSDRGTLCHFQRELLHGMRWIPVVGFPYRIFYSVDHTAGVVRIRHLIHHRRNIEDLLLDMAD